MSYRPTYEQPARIEVAETVFDRTVNVTTSSAQVVAENKQRTYCLLINDSDTIIYLGINVGAAVNQGIRLNAAGGSYEITKDNLMLSRITAIHGGTGNKVLLITEMESRYAS